MDQLTASAQKTASPQVIHQCILEPDQGSLMTMTVDPDSHSWIWARWLGLQLVVKLWKGNYFVCQGINRLLSTITAVSAEWASSNWRSSWKLAGGLRSAVWCWLFSEYIVVTLFCCVLRTLMWSTTQDAISSKTLMYKRWHSTLVWSCFSACFTNHLICVKSPASASKLQRECYVSYLYVLCHFWTEQGQCCVQVSIKGYFWSISRFDTSFQEGSVKDTKNCQGEGFCRWGDWDCSSDRWGWMQLWWNCNLDNWVTSLLLSHYHQL